MADRPRTSFVWPFDCQCIDVIVKADIELLSLVLGVMSTAPRAQSVEQPPPTFNGSLLAASKAFSGFDVASDGNTNSTGSQSSTSQHAKVPCAVSGGQPALSRVIPQQLAVQQQAAFARQARSTNPTDEPYQLPLEVVISSPDYASAGSVRAMRNGAAFTFPVSGSNTLQRVAGQPEGISSIGDRWSSGLVGSTLPWAGAKAQGVRATITLSARTRNNAPDAVATGASNTVKSETQKGASNPVLDFGQGSLSNASLGAQSNAVLYFPSNAVPDAVQSVSATTVPEVDQSSLTKTALSAISNAIPGSTSSVASNRVQNPTPSTASNEIPNSQPKAVLSAPSNRLPVTTSDTARSAVQSPAASEVSIEVQSALPTAARIAPSAVLSTAPSDMVWNAVQSPASYAATCEGQNPLLNAVVCEVTGLVSGASSNTASNAVPSPATSTASNKAQGPLPKSALSDSSIMTSATASSVAQVTSKTAATGTVTNGAQVSIPMAFAYTQSGAVPSVPLNAGPVQHAPMNLSAMGHLASTSTGASIDQAAGPATAPGQSVLATGHNLPSDIANEFAALTQLNSGMLASVQAGVSNVNRASVAQPLAMGYLDSKDGNKGRSSDVAGSSQHAQPASFHTGSQAGSQEATSSSDQSQDGGSTEGQSAAPPQIAPVSHVVAALASSPNMAIAGMPAAAPMLAGVGGHTANATANVTSVSVAVPQALPVINTAKLIQSMGQSEMRVGMRSTEFGNISISTSATRDLISAQISLDHGELAKVLSAHLPEMQARLTGNQAVDVHIDLNGEQARQSAGTSGDMSSGSAGASRGSRQQGGNTAPRYSGTEATEQHVLPVAAAMTAGDSRSNTRLDIRI